MTLNATLRARLLLAWFDDGSLQFLVARGVPALLIRFLRMSVCEEEPLEGGSSSLVNLRACRSRNHTKLLQELQPIEVEAHRDHGAVPNLGCL